MEDEIMMSPEERAVHDATVKALRKAPDGGMSLLEQTVKDARAAERLEEKLKLLRVRCAETLEKTVDTVSGFCKLLPEEVSFVSELDRESLYSAFCGMMRELEREINALQTVWTGFGETDLCRLEQRYSYAEYLSAILPEVMPGSAERAGKLMDEIRVDRSRTTDLFRTAAQLQEEWARRSLEVSSSFCARAATAADSEHNGAAMRPTELRKLCEHAERELRGLSGILMNGSF